MYILNIKGKLVPIERPWVMGIFNATPDSFYEGHLEKSAAVNVETIGQMIADGAMIIDIGGQSTRPGSKQISAEEELARVLPVIVLVKERFPDTLISIDTFYATVAKEAVALQQAEPAFTRPSVALPDDHRHPSLSRPDRA